MSGNTNQYDPVTMFQNWIRNNGNAQAQFVRNFANLMDVQTQEEFDPLATLREITDKTTEVQSRLMAEVTSAQSRNMANMFGFGQAIPSFMNWGAYKTAVGSNGRISIPEAERVALGLAEGDLVQVIIMPMAKRSKTKEVKK